LLSCTGTLIGRHTFLTAGHCATLDDIMNTGETALPMDPEPVWVFFQHAGFVKVDQIALGELQGFLGNGGNGFENDVAIFTLSEDVEHIPPSAVNPGPSPPDGTGVYFIGMGTETTATKTPRGLKRTQSGYTVACPEEVESQWQISIDDKLCSSFTATGAGDSGAPLLATADDVTVGVHQGAFLGDWATWPDVADQYLWIESSTDETLNRGACRPGVGNPEVFVKDLSGAVDPTARVASFTVPIENPAVESGTLYVTLNGEYVLDVVGSNVNNHQLYVRKGQEGPPWDCEGTNPGSFEACTFTEGGLDSASWHIRVELPDDGTPGGDFQLTVTAVPDPPDTDADGLEDCEDNCVDDFNPDQIDADLDGYGNRCDPDFDNNGVVGASDLGLFRIHFGYVEGDPEYDLLYDLDTNGGIGAADLGIFRRFFGLPPGPSGLACAGRIPCE
jgi:hypothetical protein